MCLWRRLCSAAGVLAAVALACSPGGRRDRFDVLLISLDSVRADDLSFEDAAIAPNLTALARRGTVFRQAIAGSSWTLPSHVQLFTGQPPSLHRAESDSTRIDPKTPTLPELLAERGFHTAGFWTGWYLAGEYGFARGFASYRSAMSDGEPSGPGPAGRHKRSHEDVTSANLAALAEALIGSLDPARRLFLFAHFFDPHYDYIPPGEWATRFDPDYEGSIDGRDYWLNPRIVDAGGGRVIGDRDLAQIRALYRGEIGWTDAAIGRILRALDAAGRVENTLIVVTSDHGEEFFEHGERGHRQTLFDEVLRVPLLFVLPGAPAAAAPREVAAQVELSDVLPTILDAAGIPLPASVAGRSLGPALAGRPFASRPVVSSLTRSSARSGSRRWALINETLRMPGYKLWRRTRVDASGAASVDRLVFCDLRVDPLEQACGIGGPRRAAAARAWDALERELARLREVYDRTPHASPAERATDLATSLASELAALGYVERDAVSGAPPPETLLPWGLGMRPPLELPGG